MINMYVCLSQLVMYISDYESICIYIYKYLTIICHLSIYLPLLNYQSICYINDDTVDDVMTYLYA